MSITAIVYILLILLIIWGGKLKIKPNEFNEDYLSLEVMKSLRGFAAIGVILHHISQEEKFQLGHKLSLFVNAGAVFVSIFFFCSGFGLMTSLNSKPNYIKGFFKKRLVKGVLITFYINVLLYGIVYLITGVKYPAAQWICNLLGITMMNTYAWFPVVLAILYVAFYFIFKNVKNHKIAYILMFLVIFAQGVFFCWNGHFAWWAGEKNWWLSGAALNAKWWQAEKVLWFNGEWWVNSSLSFLVGIVYADYKERITDFCKKYYFAVLPIVIAATVGLLFLSNWGQAKIGYWTEFSGMGPGIKEKFLTYLCQVPFITMIPVAVFTVMMKFRSINPISRFFGKYSLDTYLMNLLPLTYLRVLQNPLKSPIKFGNSLLIYGIAVVAVTVILGVIEYHISELVKKLLCEKRNKQEVKV